MFHSDFFHVKILSVLKLSWGKKTAYAQPRPYHALSLRLKGDAVFTSGSEKHRVAKNDLIYVPRDCAYTLDSMEKESVLVIHFDVLDASFHKIETFTPTNPDVFIENFEKIYTAWCKKGPGYEYRAVSLFYKILSNAQSQGYTYTHSIKRELVDFFEYVNSNYTDPSLTVKTMAEKLKISTTYLRKLFQQHYNTTPLKHLNMLRISYAASLLETGYYSVEEVAAMSGFYDPKYFSTCFKKHTGASPIDVKLQKLHPPLAVRESKP
jgi:YesN/AraC family two-component response regulator